MEITIQYTGQLAGLAGTSEEIADITEATTLRELVDELTGRHGSEYGDLLQTKDGHLRPSLLVIFDGEQAEGDPAACPLDGVKTVMLMTPIAGG